jgi:hypothetical protein
MDALIAIAAVALLGGLVVAAGLLTYRLWRAGMREERQLLMHRVLEREGVSLDGCTDRGTLTQTAAATRRCCSAATGRLALPGSTVTPARSTGSAPTPIWLPGSGRTSERLVERRRS